MVSPNPSFLSRRVKKSSRTEITSDRYEFLGLNQAEPDLGDPLVGPSSIGENPYPTTPANKRYILVSTPDYPGNRYWDLASNIIDDIAGDISILGIVTATEFSTGSGNLGFTTNTITGPSQIIIDPSVVGDDTGSVRIKGDLYVDGTEFIVNSTTIELADFNVGIATTVGTNELLDGAGIGIGSATIKKTLIWDNTHSALKSSENINVGADKSYLFDGAIGLTSTTLGSGVVNSSLTSLGTLSSLAVNGISTFVGDSSSSAVNISQNGSGSALLVNNPDNEDCVPVVIDNLGRVGLGTLTPTSELWVNGDGYFVGVVTAKDFFLPEGVVTANNIVGTSLSITGVSTFVNGPVNISNGHLIMGTGSIGIGTTNPTSKLWIDGDLYLTGIVTAVDINLNSDITLKKNVNIIESPIEKLMQINGVSFDWKYNNKSSMGVIAQNIEKIIPELVSGEETKAVNYNGLIGLLIEAVKYQQIEIERLKNIEK